MLSVVMLNVFVLNVVMLNVVILNVVMLNVVMQNVVAPHYFIGLVLPVRFSAIYVKTFTLVTGVN